jgi:hypothetical protein
MAINAITSSASIFHAYQNNRSSSAAADAERKNYAADLSSMVSISAEGKQASQAAQAAGGHTVEMYSLPVWMADYTVPIHKKACIKQILTHLIDSIFFMSTVTPPMPLNHLACSISSVTGCG